jgi:HEAT repeat protein
MILRSLILCFSTLVLVSGLGVMGPLSMSSRAETVAPRQLQDSENNRQLAILIARLKSQNWRDRSEAASMLGRGGAIAKPAVPSLVQLVKDPVSEVRIMAIDALLRLGEERQLLPFLDDADPTTRLEVAFGLSMMEKNLDEIVPKMVPFLQDPDPMIRMLAADILGHTGTFATVAVPHLLPLLQDPNPKVRARAIYALGRVGELSSLVSLIRDPDVQWVQSTLRDALGRKGALSQKEFMYQQLQDLGSKPDAIRPDPFESTRQSIVVDIIPFLQDRDPVVRSNAALVLGAMGPIAKSANPYLMPLLQDQDLGVASSAKAALKQIENQP